MIELRKSMKRVLGTTAALSALLTWSAAACADDTWLRCNIVWDTVTKNGRSVEPSGGVSLFKKGVFLLIPDIITPTVFELGKPKFESDDGGQGVVVFDLKDDRVSLESMLFDKDKKLLLRAQHEGVLTCEGDQ